MALLLLVLQYDICSVYRFWTFFSPAVIKRATRRQSVIETPMAIPSFFVLLQSKYWLTEIQGERRPFGSCQHLCLGGRIPYWLSVAYLFVFAPEIEPRDLHWQGLCLRSLPLRDKLLKPLRRPCSSATVPGINFSLFLRWYVNISNFVFCAFLGTLPEWFTEVYCWLLLLLFFIGWMKETWVRHKKKARAREGRSKKLETCPLIWSATSRYQLHA